jgi:hypothetical protein
MNQELERIQAGLEYEQKLRREKKEKEMRIHRSTVAENEENDRRKLLQKQQEQEEELKRNQLYDQRLMAEENARQEALKKRFEKIDKITQSFQVGGSDQTAQAKKDTGAGEAEGEEGEVFTWEGATNAQKAKIKQEKLQKIKFENLNLFQTKLERQKELKLKDLEDGLRLKEESTKYNESEKKRRFQEQQKKKTYGLSLQHQMEEKHHAAMSAMTKPEKSVNQKELKLIQSDPNLHSRIAHRLRMQTAPGTARELSTLALTRFVNPTSN